MNFVLLVEGHTEKKALAPFLKRWLDPQLDKPIGIKIARFNGCSHFLKGFAKKSKTYLSGPSASKTLAVFGLLDFHGPDIIPRDSTPVDKRVADATKKLEADVKDDRFRMFFAVHEIEAWLLSDPQLFPTEVRKALAGKENSPEEVDDDTPPAKLLGRLYEKSGRHYKKTVDGAELFGRLDPNLAYEKCPHLKSMLDEMLAMAQKAGY